MNEPLSPLLAAGVAEPVLRLLEANGLADMPTLAAWVDRQQLGGLDPAETLVSLEADRRTPRMGHRTATTIVAEVARWRLNKLQEAKP